MINLFTKHTRITETTKIRQSLRLLSRPPAYEALPLDNFSSNRVKTDEALAT